MSDRLQIIYWAATVANIGCMLVNMGSALLMLRARRRCEKSERLYNEARRAYQPHVND